MLAAVAILSFVVLLLTMPRDLNIFDEGIILSHATRVLHGEIIHRDFYTNYGPGQYYIVAGLFRFFGENFMVARLYDLTIRAAVVAMLFYIIRKQCPLAIALIFTVMGGMWLAGINLYLSPIFPCMLLSLIGSYLVTHADERPLVSPAIIGAGVCTGFTALFRYETGFLLLIAHLVSIAAIVLLSYPRETRVRRILAAIAAYGGGTAVVFVPAAIAFLLVSPINAFIADIIDYSTKYYAAMRGLPFPGLQDILLVGGPGRAWQTAVYLPLLAGGLALIQLIPLIQHRLKPAAPRSGGDRSIEYLIVFGSTACLLFLKGVIRVHATQMLMGIMSALVVFAVLADLWWRRGNAMRLAAAVLSFFVLSYPAALVAHGVGGSIRVYDKDSSIAGWLALRAGLIPPSAGNAGACETGPASGIAKLSPDYARVATYLGAHSQPDEGILVALDRHDKIYMNPVGLYFAAGRRPATHWHQFDPGLQTRADIQAAIVTDLQRNRVRWVVRDATFDGSAGEEPNGSSRSSGIILLDRYIDENYRPVASSGKVAIWLANWEQPPIAEGKIDKCEATPIQPLTKSQ